MCWFVYSQLSHCASACVGLSTVSLCQYTCWFVYSSPSHCASACVSLSIVNPLIVPVLQCRSCIFKELRTGLWYVHHAVVWSCLPFIRSGQNHFARHSERGKKTRQTEEEVGRQHQGMDRPGVGQVPEGSGEQGKMEETGCEIIYGAPTTLGVKG